jgi:hypothetical protein
LAGGDWHFEGNSGAIAGKIQEAFKPKDQFSNRRMFIKHTLILFSLSLPLSQLRIRFSCFRF